MDGVLIIDKPEDWTSHDVVAKVRRIFKIKRVGHTGTLDPFATGVLVVLIGKAARLAQFLDKDEKEYEAVIQFGFETDTGDGTGNPLADFNLPPDTIAQRLAEVDWNATLQKFRGEIEQIPPMYSAKKVEGKKLYEMARQGIIKERQPIKVLVNELEIIGKSLNECTVDVRVACSAGTYIRTLAEDIGRAIGVGAHLKDLRRTRAGKFTSANALTVDQLERSDDPTAYIQNIRVAVEHLPELTLSPDRVEKTRSGLATRILNNEFSDDRPISMTDETGELIAIGFYNPRENAVQPKIVLV